MEGRARSRGDGGHWQTGTLELRIFSRAWLASGLVGLRKSDPFSMIPTPESPIGTRGRWLARVLGCLVVLAALWHTDHVFEVAREHSRLSPQSRQMRRAAHKESLSELVQECGPWPPGYPLALRAVETVGVPTERVNQMFFCLSWILLWIVVRRCWPGVWAPGVIALYASLAPHYFILVQYNSEALVVPASLGVFAVLLGYLRSPRLHSVLAAAVLCSVVFVSRYHPVFWLFPLVLLVLQWPRMQARRRLVWAGLFALVALGPSIWIAWLKRAHSGYLTGVERFGPRRLPQPLAYFADEIGFWDNLALSAKTLWIDFSSPSLFATHFVNHEPHRPTWIEWVIASMTAACVLLWMRGYPKLQARTWFQILGAQRNSPSPGLLALGFFASYLVATVAVWTFSNNDPIYTRFLYPSYPFLLLSGVAAYASLDGSPWTRKLPAWGLCLLLLCTQVYKSTIGDHYP